MTSEAWQCPDSLEGLVAEAKLFPCGRCGVWLQFAHEQRNPDARLLRKSAVPEGYCVNCAATHWFQHGPEPTRSLMRSTLEIGTDRKLLDPGFQVQFARLLCVGRSDAKWDEIDWPTVVKNWDIAFPCKPVGAEGFSCRFPSRKTRA